MNVNILTSLYGDKWEKLQPLVEQNRKDYAEEQDCTYKIINEKVYDNKYGYWDKIDFIIKEIQKTGYNLYSYTMWCEADCIICNQSKNIFNIKSFPKDIIISSDFNSGCFIVQHSKFSYDFLFNLLKYREFTYLDRAFELEYKKNIYTSDFIDLIHPRILNSQLHIKESTYREGDFILHLVDYPIDLKIQLLEYYYNIINNFVKELKE